MRGEDVNCLSFEDFDQEPESTKTLQDDDKDLTSSVQRLDEFATNSLRVDDKNFTSSEQILDMFLALTLRVDDKDLTSPEQKLDTLINLESKSFNSIDLKQQPQQQKEVAVVVNGWDIGKILDFGGVSGDKRKKLLSECKKNKSTGEKFIAQLMCQVFAHLL